MNHAEVNQAMIALRKRFEKHCVKHKLPFPIRSLQGACGICSLLAFRALKRMGLKPSFHMNDSHCFVTIRQGKKYWIDLTLTQFVPASDPVFFADHPYRYDIGSFGFVHRCQRKAKTERAIRKLFSKWPDEQNPFFQTLPRVWKKHLTIPKLEL